MKQRYKVEGKTVQVADKGLNCARNIYSAVKEAKDGYIFSKSVHGKNLSNKEKQWLLLENDVNVLQITMMKRDICCFVLSPAQTDFHTVLLIPILKQARR